MSDRAFSGRNVQEALEQAAHALGLRTDRLRYVVLDPGNEGGRGLKPTPARIAILLGGSAGAPTPPPESRTAAEPPAARGPKAPLLRDEPRPERLEPAEPGPSLESEATDLVAALARTADLRLTATVRETADTFRISLQGPDATEFLLGSAGQPVVLEALEHLLFARFARRIAPRRLLVECEGEAERREETIKAMARELAEGVLLDARPRTTPPLNAYERRLVHLAIEALPGVITYSVGDGASRRVTVAPEEASLGGEVH
jgi:spoIIIJ-associated protein